METRDAAVAESEPGFFGRWNPITELPLWAVPALFAAVAALAALLSALFPDAFHARILWQYYWGPIKADALGVPYAVYDGVLAYPGFNLVNTVSWLVLTLLCVLWTLQCVHACGIRRTDTFTIGCAAWVVTGSVGHVLQDTGLIARPLEYFFITPTVFLVYWLLGLASVTWGALAARVDARHGARAGLALLAAPLLAQAVGWALLQWRDAPLLEAWVHPLVLPAFTLLTFGVLWWRRDRLGRVEPTEVIGLYVIPWAGLHVAFILKWAFFTQWGSLPARGTDAALPWALVIAPVATAAVVAALAGVAWLAFRKRAPALVAGFLLPVHVLVTASQVADGLVTAMGMDLRGYAEKHVLPRFLIAKVGEWGESAGVALAASYPAFLVFPALKVVVAFALVSFATAFFGVPARGADGAREYAPWHWGLILGIIVIGLAPAARNLVRLTLGV